jgi:APA family basic amino acid/polyamine antiporter
MIGTGVFLLAASVALCVGIGIFGWVITATGAMLLALVFGRLSRIVPKAGGPYAYTQKGFGDFAGFFVAWGYWISIWAGNSAIAAAFVGYTGVFVPGLAENAALAGGTAIAAIWFLIWVNALGVRNAGILQLVTTVLKLLPLIAIGTLGLLYFDAENLRPFNMSGESSFAAISATAALTLYAFLGLESATIPADDVQDPRRTIARATVLGTLAAAVVYILGTAAVMGVISPLLLAGSTAPFADAASVMWGNWASYAIAAGAAISAFGALNGWILLSGQIPMAMAKDGLFPAVFARVSERRTPVTGFVVSGVLASALIMMSYSRGLVGAFTFILLLATLAALVPYVFCSLAEFAIPRESGGRFGGRPGLYLAVPVLAFIYSLWTIAGSGRDTVYWGFLLLLAGVPVFVWMRWRGQPQAS